MSHVKDEGFSFADVPYSSVPQMLPEMRKDGTVFIRLQREVTRPTPVPHAELSSHPQRGSRLTPVPSPAGGGLGGVPAEGPLDRRRSGLPP